MSSPGLLKLIETKLETTCIYLKQSFFKKTQRFETSLPALELVSLIFCMTFEEKHFSCYIILSDHISMSGCLYFVRHWAISVLQFFVRHNKF